MLDAIPATTRSSMLPCAMRPVPEVVVVEPPALRRERAARRERVARTGARRPSVATAPAYGGWYASAVLAALLAVVWMHTPTPTPNRSRGVPAERYRHGSVVDRGLATLTVARDAS